MDTTPLLPLIVLGAATAVLALLAAAEAAVIQIARRRVGDDEFNGLPGLLRGYVLERQRLLRTLRFGISAATVGATVAAIVIATKANIIAVTGTTLLIFVALNFLRAAARLLAESHGDAAARRLYGPVTVILALLSPIESILRWPIAIPMRAFGVRSTVEEMDPAEELIGLLEATDDEDGALVEERRMMRGVLELSGQTVRELMTPRTDVTALANDATIADATRLVASTGFTRIPLYEESLDRVVGVIYAKDLLAYVGVSQARTGQSPALSSIARPPYRVPESKRANELLADLRRDKVHLAIVVDEYGGTAGVITVEDLIEEIVGEITDEYDTVDTDIQRVTEDEVIVDASLTIDELNELFETEIVPDDFDTVGGLIVSSLGRLALPGDAVVAPRIDGEEDERAQLELRVMTILGRRIKKVRVWRYVPAEDATEATTEAV